MPLYMCQYHMEGVHEQSAVGSAVVLRAKLAWSCSPVPMDLQHMPNPLEVFAPSNIGRQVFVQTKVHGVNWQNSALENLCSALHAW